jgi:hypothetical protein
MNDKEIFGLQLRATIVPQQARWELWGVARSASAGRKALKKIVGNTLVALTHRAPMTGVLSLATSVWSRLQIAVLR